MVSQLTGLSELVIRAWETRYKAVVPDRKGNRRIYSEIDIEKLALLKKLTDDKYRIGNIANYSLDELKDIITINDLKKLEIKDKPENAINENFVTIIADSISYIRNFDSKNLDTLLNNCAVEFSRNVFIDNIIIPLMDKVGEYWKSGILRISHEHFASTTVRKIVSSLIGGFKLIDDAPEILISTPQGQYHEIGALIAGTLASGDGWNVVYLGPSLPIEEIVYTAQKTKPVVIFMSIVYPSDDPQLLKELLKLKELEYPSKLVFSGKSIGGYNNTIQEIGGEIVNNSEELRTLLKSIRDANSVN